MAEIMVKWVHSADPNLPLDGQFEGLDCLQGVRIHLACISGHSFQYIIAITEVIFSLHPSEFSFLFLVGLNSGREQGYPLFALKPQQEGMLCQNEEMSSNDTGMCVLCVVFSH